MINIQIFGVKNCRDTQKTERFFKERRIAYQFINLEEKGMSRGELNSIKNSVGLENLVNSEGKEYKRRGLEYMDFDPEEELLENPMLFKTPVVRNSRQATAGYQPTIWESWIADN